MAYHGHSFFCQTSISTEHQHILGGITSFTADKKDHKHRIRGIASGGDGKSHSFFFQSSMEIPLEDGGHTHSFEGYIQESEGHNHFVESELGPY